MDLRDIERQSIRAFVQSAADEGYLSGRVLDYGCGKQPYRDIVEAAGGEYVGYDRKHYPANVSGEDVGSSRIWKKGAWDAILCTQVVQYVMDEIVAGYPMEHDVLQSGVWGLLGDFKDIFVADSHLVLTYPTNWPEVEPEDLHRFTKAGMERLLTEAGFEIVRHERRATVNALWGKGRESTYSREEWALGYGVIARA